MRPFFKSVGGKSWLVERLVPEIEALTPKLYVEPFVGGGAIALGLNPTIPKILSDANTCLIDAWLCVQRVPGAVAAELQALYAREGSKNAWERATTYLAVRDELNEMIHSSRTMWPARGARFLYLNARAFNGLWRTNRSGEFNVPWGKYESPRELTLDDLRVYTIALAKVTIKKQSAFATLADLVARGDLSGTVIYADPPYDGTFDGYTADGFEDTMQAALADGLYSCAERGAKIFASNADTPRVRELYGWAEIEALDERHSVGAKADRRGARGCVLIRG